MFRSGGQTRNSHRLIPKRPCYSFYRPTEEMKGRVNHVQLGDGGHHIISKIVMGDETCIPFFDNLTRQESNAWVIEDDPTPTLIKRQRTMKKVIYTVFFRSTISVKAIKLEKQKTVVANYNATKSLPEILQEVNVR
ncbi:uncharacterized protein TNCV_1782821 [Trichonephila clavipes]|nr:uncharacterized protein TNCV_1782821 [Trichonephila clavipes]